tara:strand:+ start:236 stop:460 length:225 start_codon:yes stop_codon:yes gene_type:complete
MGDIDLSEFDEARSKKPKGQIDLFLLEAEEGRRESLLAALRDLSYPSTAISRVLTQWGTKISADTVQVWRRKNL